MSTISAVSPTPTTNSNLIRSEWTPPTRWDDSSSTPDDRAWIESLAALGLRSKACSAFECGDYYIPILVYRDHYVRLGRATCQCKTCRDCGTGRMRVHRMYRENPQRFEIITSQSCRTLSLTIHYSTPCATPAEYLARVHSHRADLARLRSRMVQEFKGEHGYTATPEFDRHLRDVVWRVYFVGYDPGHWWFAHEWQRIVGMSAACSSRKRGSNEAKDGLRWTMDAIDRILMLPGAERAIWEAAMQGYRLTSSVGCLRAVEVDAKPSVPDSGDPAAPYGRCPCGCNGILERPDDQSPAPRSWFDTNFTLVDTGGIKTYSAKNRSNLGAAGEGRPHKAAISPSPPS
jgi:hypothetical protein